ncbi:MAG: hypothetical protein OXB88_04915, partial [Bacteriovoracales bacterium]|nr:hypothetical protein [Bacteriovoracales bacterium]
MILAPCIGTLFDRFSKKTMSIFIDGSYALLLIATSFLFFQGKLNDMAFLVATILIQAFSQVHMQSIGFSAVKKHASEHGGRYLALMFALSNGAGIALSGITFSLVGFYGCMAIGVLTFIPIIFFYPFLFDGEGPSSREKSSLVDSLRFLWQDRVLLKFGIVLGLFNVVGALFPAFLKLEINRSLTGSDYLTAPILAGGLFISVLFYRKIDIVTDKLRGGTAFCLSFIPILLAAASSWFFPHIVTLSLLYLTACFGSGLRNIVTGNLRNKRVPREKISGVNTLYGAFLSIGPLLGGLFVIPIVENNMEQGLVTAIAVVCTSVLFSILFLPKERVGELSRENT